MKFRSSDRHTPFPLYHRSVAIVLGLLLTAVGLSGGYVLYRTHQLGAFHEPRNFFQGSCRPITHIPGPEDLDRDPVKGVVYISSSDRRQAQGDAAVRGGIWMLRIVQGEPVAEELPMDQPADFQPHGISLYTGNAGGSRLFVINHRLDGTHTVEIFDLPAVDSLVHVATIRSEHLVSPNDLAATGPKQFFFTNDGRSRSNLARTIDILLNRGTGSIGYFDGRSTSLAARQLFFANGIVFHETENRLYVAETTSGMLRSYDVDPATGELELHRQHHLGVGLDNIVQDSRGSLWIARHPDLIALSANRNDPSKASPSEVLSITETDRGTLISETVYSNNGEQVSGASVALPFRSHLLIGSVFDSTILVCRMAGTG